MSKEGSTYKNPVKAYTSGTTWTEADKAKIQKIFSNQTPGTFLEDFGQSNSNGGTVRSVWFCTKYTNGEPLNNRVWVRTFLVDGKPKATTNYAILVKGGEAGTSYVYRRNESSGKADPVVAISFTGRYGYNDIGTQKGKFQWGTYTFVGLGVLEIENLQKQLGGGAETTITIPGAAAAVAATNAGQNSATGGRSGTGTNTGSSQNTPPATNTPSNPSNSPAAPTTPAAKKAGPKTPGKNTTNKSAKNNKSSGSQNNGLSTVTIKKLPEKIYSNGINFTNTNPYMEQRYTIPGAINTDGVSEIKQIVRRHIFDILPNSFEFSSLSSAWEEVPRSGNFNMMDWSKYNLTKVGFKFLIQGRRTDTFAFPETRAANGALIPAKPSISTSVNDGMSVSIDEQVANIRQIGAAPYPVRLYNLNTLLTDEYRFPYESPGKGIQWIIGDMNITASRVTPKARNIAVAEVNITLIEYPEIGREIIYIPPLVPTQPTPKCTGPKCKTTTTQPLGLQSSTYQFTSKNDLGTPNPTQPDTTTAA